MHIIALHHYAGSSLHGMAFRVYYLAKEWIKEGHTVTILASSYSHNRRINPEVNDKYEVEYIDGIKYIWVKTRKYSGNGVSRILNMFDFIKGSKKLIPLLCKENPDVVVTMSTYLLDNYIANKISKKTSAKYICEIRDLWPLSPQLLGGYSKWHPFILFLQFAQKFAYKHCDELVTVLPCSKDYMIQNGLKEEKFHYIPNGIYIPEISIKEKLNEDFEKQLPKDKEIIGYCGSLGLANSLDTLVEVAKLVNESHPQLFFAIVGKGPEKDNLNSLIQKNKLKNILILDAIPKSQVQSFLKLCSVVVITWNDCELYQYGISPNKLFDYMYSSTPIVQSVKAGNDILKDAKCGITCDLSPEAIRDSILQILSLTQEERELMGKNGYDFVLKYHNYEYLAREFINVIEQ